jgi:nucleotide-binding universal stress UspA family protein
MATGTLVASKRSNALNRPVEAGVKTILLHVQNDAAFDARLQAALSLSRACDAHLSCLHVTPIEAYVAFDNFGGVFVMNDVIKTLQAEEAKLRAKVEEKLRFEGVNFGYEQTVGNVATQVISHGALTDLIIVGREPHRSDFAGPTIGFLGDLLHRSRTPLFIPGNDAGPIDLAGSAIIAWDSSYEAANAVRAAVGLLKIASDVRIIQVREEGKKEAFPAMRLLQFLSRHDIHAVVETDRPVGAEGEAIAGILLSRAEAGNAAYMVMRGYNHSRIGEYLFGGVTRALLGECSLPLLIAH